VISEFSLSGRGQGRMSNFHVVTDVDLENFATASRRYTGDIHISAPLKLRPYGAIQICLLLLLLLLLSRPWSVCLWHL